ncbi:MAG: hypothetical protein NUV34_08565 [Sulfuricaulis sp.]|nr:hypothetical protein [Sulfuricaulis sp.]
MMARTFEQRMARVNRIRMTPDDFAPEMTLEEGKVVGRYQAEPGLLLTIGFVPTGDPLKDVQLQRTLRRSLWMSAELHRLGLVSRKVKLDG